jgi:hypothetical protein
MDGDGERRKVGWLLFSAVALLASCCISFHELTYFVRGRQANGTVTRSYETVLRGRSGFKRGTVRTVEYTFKEPDGSRRSGSDTVPLDWPLSADGTVGVQYMPGADGQSRLAGHINIGGVALFVGMCSLVAFFLYRVLREASEATRPASSRRKG